MAVLRPCIGCTARAHCEIKASVVLALRGQPVTAAKVKCTLPFTKYFPPGTRVRVAAWDHRDYVAGDNPFYEDRAPSKMVPATVVGPSSKKRGQLLCHLDTSVLSDHDTEIEFRAAWPKDVERLDEPRADHCNSCDRAYVKGQCSCPPQVDQDGW